MRLQQLPYVQLWQRPPLFASVLAQSPLQQKVMSKNSFTPSVHVPSSVQLISGLSLLFMIPSKLNGKIGMGGNGRSGGGPSDGVSW